MSALRILGIATATGVTLAVALVASGVFGGPKARAVNKPAPASDPTAVNAIHFDHTIHVRKYGMQCLDCHVYATQSTVAGLPALRKCMGCHKFVDKKKPGVMALAKLWEEGKPPQWRRVYQLPGYVYFSHEMHLANKVECKACHGDVGGMHRVVKVTSLNMGFCLGCHEKRHATVSCIACHK